MRQPKIQRYCNLRQEKATKSSESINFFAVAFLLEILFKLISYQNSCQLMYCQSISQCSFMHLNTVRDLVQNPREPPKVPAPNFGNH